MIRFSAIIALTTLAGCKTAVTTDLFTSDLIAATEGEELTAPAVVSLQSPSEQKCKEAAPAVLSAIQTQYQSAEFIGCEQDGFNTFTRFRIQAKIIANRGVSSLIDEAFAIGVRQDGLGYQISYVTNSNAARAIWGALPEDLTLYQSFEFNPTLSAVLNNDLREAVTIKTDDVFADGVPIQGTATRELKRRDQIELQMSDVTNAAFGSVDTQSMIVEFKLR